MGDLAGSRQNPIPLVVRWLNWGQYRLEGTGELGGVRPTGTQCLGYCVVSYLPVGDVLTQAPALGVDLRRLSGLRQTGSYTVSTPIGWWRKGLIG
ncbi:hypothetical protein FNV43_RR07295 [Rhamnella rubrinervis]|uniref:Uncharacterized protein n=1 Tax=Rhamnella rubrinervis TaxID=2594499 RepID=A0A8K0HEI0_9ROSA|nr:hypothetical protein FNV43_RR07295 [Rhamnella rubrinervis]